jgi:sodium transport system ATP-binding protein
MPNPLELDQLEKSFGSRRAVVGLTLSVSAGEVYGLLGPNGAGKTTTLRMIAGLLTPTSGTVHVAGVDVVKAPEAAKAALGFLTGSTGLYARLSVREVLRFFGRAYGMDEDLLGRRINELAALLAIEALLDRRCEGLSTGERQRVSLARAVLHDPPVLVLDEPTNGLDVLASRFLRELVRKERDRGKAIIFSTHYMAEADLLCDRIGFIYRGRMIREATPAALRTAAGTQSLEEVFLNLAAEVDENATGEVDYDPNALVMPGRHS